MSRTRKGRKLPPFTEEHIYKLSEASKGNLNFLGKTHTKETKEKLRKITLNTKKICKRCGKELTGKDYITHVRWRCKNRVEQRA